jgi:CheY-like chemotaxis protein
MTVLIVDDYTDARDVWAIYLKGCGYDVATSADGVEALAAVRTVHPDVVVMDLQMPGLSGIEVAAALRADENTCHIPLIAVTGRTRTSLEDAKEAGFDSLLMKPCEPDLLVAEIRRLGNWRAARVAPPVN